MARMHAQYSKYSMKFLSKIEFKLSLNFAIPKFTGYKEFSKDSVSFGGILGQSHSLIYNCFVKVVHFILLFVLLIV